MSRSEWRKGDNIEEEQKGAEGEMSDKEQRKGVGRRGAERKGE